MPISLLKQRILIRLSGDDCVDFLQGIISNNANMLLKDEAIYTALLSPQGKFLYDFFLIPWKENIFLDVAENRIDDLIARLKIYRLRSKIEIEIANNLSVFTLWYSSTTVSKNHEYKVYKDPRMPELGLRIIGNKKSIKENFIDFVAESEYEKLRVDLCIPDTSDMIIEKSLLLEFGFEKLHGVDFSKGCYIGQEVTARSKFRGQVRKNIYKIIGEENILLPAIGTSIISEEKSIGELRSSIDNIGIAIINNDDYEFAKNNNKQFFCAEKNIKIILPNWL